MHGTMNVKCKKICLRYVFPNRSKGITYITQSLMFLRKIYSNILRYYLPTKKQTNQLTNKQRDRLNDSLIDWLTDRPTNRPPKQPTNQLGNKMPTNTVHGADSLLRSSASSEILASYKTRMFFTAFTRFSYLSLSWARSIQSILPYILGNLIAIIKKFIGIGCAKVRKLTYKLVL